jgi:hypothetical protein
MNIVMSCCGGYIISIPEVLPYLGVSHGTRDEIMGFPKALVHTHFVAYAPPLPSHMLLLILRCCMRISVVHYRHLICYAKHMQIIIHLLYYHPLHHHHHHAV